MEETAKERGYSIQAEVARETEKALKAEQGRQQQESGTRRPLPMIAADILNSWAKQKTA